jgi:hypothetical protein
LTVGRPGGTLASMTRHELQVFYLNRLGHLVELHGSMGTSWTPAECRLVDQALYATYQGCKRVGLQPVARAMLAELRGKKGNGA